MNLNSKEIQNAFLRKRIAIKFRMIFNLILGNGIPLVLVGSPLFDYLIHGKESVEFTVIGFLALIFISIVSIRYYNTLKFHKIELDFKEVDELGLTKDTLKSLGWAITKSSDFYVYSSFYSGDSRWPYDLYIIYEDNSVYVVCFDEGYGLSLHVNVHTHRMELESRLKRLYQIEKNRFYRKNEIVPDLEFDINQLNFKDVEITLQVLRVTPIDLGFPPFKVKGKIVDILSNINNEGLHLIIMLEKKISNKTMNLKSYKKVSQLSILIYPKYINNFIGNKEVLSKAEYFKQAIQNRDKVAYKDERGRLRQDGELITFDAKIKLI